MDVYGLNNQTILLFCGWALWAFFSFSVALLLPGIAFLGESLKARSWAQRIILSLGAGTVLWVFQALLFGYLNIRWATYAYLVLAGIVGLKHLKWSKPKIPFLLVILVFIGGAGQMLQNVASGFVFPQGWYSFIADDALYHLGVTGALVKDVPPLQPGMSGVFFSNYHYFGNLFIAEFLRVFRLPVFLGQFLFSYMFFSLMLGSLLYVLLRRIGISRVGSAIGVYLGYFASDVIYLTIYLVSRVWVFTVHPLEDGTMFLENPPRAFARILTLIGLLALVEWERTRRIPWAVFSVMALSFVVGAKVHEGLMVMMGAMGLMVFALVKKKWATLAVATFILAGSWIVRMFLFSSSGGPLYSPFEMARTFVVQPLVGLSGFELRRVIYMAHFNIVRALQMDLTMLAIFLLSQFGIRNLAWLAIPTALRWRPSGAIVFLTSGLIGTTVLATLFIQPLVASDIFNSYLAGSIALTVLTVIFLERYIANKRALILFTTLLLALTLPRWIYRGVTEVTFIKNHPSPLITNAELEASQFIRQTTEKDTLVWVLNTGHWDSHWAYVSAITGRYTYLSGQFILSNQHVDTKHREEAIHTLLTSVDPEEILNVLHNEGIELVYVYNANPLPSVYNEVPLRVVFENTEITIYEVPGI
jgi:hypothetical protein